MFDLPLSVFFSLVTPCALTVAGKNNTLLWRRPEKKETPLKKEMQETTHSRGDERKKERHSRGNERKETTEILEEGNARDNTLPR